MHSESFALNLAMVGAALVLLWKGADTMVDASVRIARSLGISEIIVGLTIIGFGTSAPEFAVSLEGAARGQSGIALGNVVGSNVFNLGFVLGGCALIRPIVSNKALVYRDSLFLAGVAALLVLLVGWDSHLSRWDGVLLASLLIGYLYYLWCQRAVGVDDTESDGEVATLLDGLWLPLGLVAIMLGGHLLIAGASGIARAFGLSEWLIGVTVVAAGTSTPELFTSLNAARKGLFGMSAGNLIGSDLFNMLGVLGAAALVRPMSFESDTSVSLLLAFASILLVAVFLRTGWRLSRGEAVVLVLFACARWAFEVLR